MAIAKVGSADAVANTVALPAFTPGDFAILFAFNANAATNPTAAAGWTVYSNGGANLTGFQIAYRRLIAGDTTTGVWTNATHIEVIVLSGVETSQPVGPTGLSASAATNSVNWPALTLSDSSARNWVVLFGGHRSASDMNSVALAGTTNESPTSGALAMHTARGVASWASTSKTVNAALGWRTYGIEVKAAGGSDRVSTEVVETVVTPDDRRARISQEAVESVTLPIPKGRVTQEAVEVANIPIPPGRMSQEAVEVILLPANAAARVTQDAVEVIARKLHERVIVVFWD